MSYEKQNFEDGQVLEAEHLNKMEDELARPKSWNELANRPFYKEERVIFEKQTVELVEDNGAYAAQLVCSENVTVGDIVFVEFNGETTEFTAAFDPFGFGIVCFGDIATMTPYGVLCAENNIRIISAVTSGNVTVEIRKIATVQIPVEFVPATAATLFVKLYKNEAGTVVCSKTVDEIKAAVHSGKGLSVYCDDGLAILCCNNLLLNGEAALEFTTALKSVGGSGSEFTFKFTNITLTASGAVTVQTYNIAATKVS